MNTENAQSEHSRSTVFVSDLPYSFANSQLEETFSNVGPIRSCFLVTEEDDVKTDEDKNLSTSKNKEIAQSKHSSCTIFVSNLPFSFTNSQFKEMFSEVGPIRRCFLVTKKGSTEHRGFGFVVFDCKEDADRAIELKNGVSVGGQKIGVKHAMPLAPVEQRKSKSNQDHVKTEKDKKSAHEKKLRKKKTVDHSHRNLYLAKEGLIVEGTPAAEGVSASDMSRRKKLEEKRKIMLQSSNFHVSKTQLVIYNLPRFMTEKELRKLLIDAVVSRATKQNPVIWQVKLLGNPIKENVKSKSRFHRVALVEFSEHQHALVALRFLNNNPETFGPNRRPIVSFAIDDVRKLKLRKFGQQQPVHYESEGMQHNDEAKTPRTSPSKEKSRKRKPTGDIRSSDTREAIEEETTENRTSGGATTKKEKPAKKQKRTQANVKENKLATKETPQGLKQRNKSRQKRTNPRPESKPDAADKPDFMPKKRKLQEAGAEPGRNNGSKQQKKSGKDQNASSGKEVVDLLHRLIEQYR